MKTIRTKSAPSKSVKTITNSESPATKRRKLSKKASLNRVMNYNYQPLINRLSVKEGFSANEAESVFKDMLRFLYLCGTHEGVFAPSERIDRAWHAFLLFTKEYSRFCHESFGFFIHHNPREAEARPVNDDGPSVIWTTLQSARAAFGDLSDNWHFESVDAYNCAKCSTPSTSCDNYEDSN